MSNYQEIYQEKKKKQLLLWKEMIENLFGEESDVSIKGRNEIVKNLNKIGSSKALNHTFIPSGGGLDLTGAAYSNESGKVELKFGSTCLIVNPESLNFHKIGDNPEWWYFRLETLPFESSGVYEVNQQEEAFKSASNNEVEWKMRFYGEEVLEIEPGEYMERSYWDLNHLGYDEYGDEIPLPENARVVTRKYNGGAFVIFPKFSAYNHNPSTYDARHNKMDEDGFNQYISKIVEELNKEMSK
jgi:hypothetical protein